MVAVKKENADIKLMVGKYESKSYGAIKARDTLRDWGIPFNGVTDTDDIKQRAIPNSLLGKKMGTILRVTTQGQTQSLNDALLKFGDDKESIRKAASSLAGNGMVIILNINGTYRESKALMSTLKTAGIKLDEPSKNRNGELADILSRCSLNEDVKSQLSDYVGQQYDMLMPVIRSIEDMPEEEQREITYEDLLIRLPSQPGAIPPWKIEDYVLRGDVNGAMSVLDRVMSSGQLPIQIAGWLAGAITTPVIVYSMSEFAGMSMKDVMQTKGITGWKTKKVSNAVRRLKGRSFTECDAFVKNIMQDLTYLKKAGRKPILDDDGKQMMKVDSQGHKKPAFERITKVVSFDYPSYFSEEAGRRVEGGEMNLMDMVIRGSYMYAG